MTTSPCGKSESIEKARFPRARARHRRWAGQRARNKRASGRGEFSLDFSAVRIPPGRYLNRTRSDRPPCIRFWTNWRRRDSVVVRYWRGLRHYA